MKRAFIFLPVLCVAVLALASERLTPRNVVWMGLFGKRAAAVNSLTNNAVAHWALDEASGTRLDSISGLDLTDVLSDTTNGVGVITNGAGPFSYSGALTHDDDPLLSLNGDQDFTIVCWVKTSNPLANNFPTIVEKGDDGTTDGNEYWLLYSDSFSAFAFVVGNETNSESVVASETVSTGTWYHLAARYNSALQKIFLTVNATNEYSTNWTGATIDTTNKFMLGNSQAGGVPAGECWSNLVDEVTFFRRALSSNEIWQIRAAEAAGKPYPWQ